MRASLATKLNEIRARSGLQYSSFSVPVRPECGKGVVRRASGHGPEVRSGRYRRESGHAADTAKSTLLTLNRRIGMSAVRSGVKSGAYQHQTGSRASATLFYVGPTPPDGWACPGLCHRFSRRFRGGRTDLDLCQDFERPAPEVCRCLNMRADHPRTVRGRSDWTVERGAE